jgi:hypothetical protein
MLELSVRADRSGMGHRYRPLAGSVHLMHAHNDIRLLDTPMATVTCGLCGAEVLARKSSAAQTSILWDCAATARCEERRLSGGPARPGTGLFGGCSALRASIESAVVRGEVTVVDDKVDTSETQPGER